MVGLWRSIRVLCWKNWRVKQRESLLNRRRIGRRNQWLFPALLLEMVLPLVVLLLVTRAFCAWNAAIGMGPSQDLRTLSSSTHRLENNPQQRPLHSLLRSLVGGKLSSAQQWHPSIGSRPAEAEMSSDRTQSSLFMTALPLLLSATNQSLAVLNRSESLAFLAFLDREYPPSSELGVPSYRDVTKVVPCLDPGISASEADESLRAFATSSGFQVYATLDLRASSDSGKSSSPSFELMTVFHGHSFGIASRDQIQQYFSLYMIRKLRFLVWPSILPFHSQVNLFLRQDARKTLDMAATISHLDDTFLLPPPSVVCETIMRMLIATGLQWEDFSATSPLGTSKEECMLAVRKGGLSHEVLRFLSQLMEHVEARDQLQNLRVEMLPMRPKFTTAGVLAPIIALFLEMLFLLPFTQLVRDVVLEKEKLLKEYLLIMGLQSTALIASWVLLYFAATVAVCALAVAALSGAMFVATFSSQWHFFLLLLTFGSSVLIFGAAVTPFFSTSSSAVAKSSLVFFALSAGPFIRHLVGEYIMDKSVVLNGIVSALEQISSPEVFMAALRDVLAFNAATGALRPVAWSAVSSPCQQMVLQSAGYLLLGWYVENVFPRTYGVQQRWYFVFTPSFWFPSFRNERGDIGCMDLRNASDEDGTLREWPLRDSIRQHKPALLVDSLSKRYPNGKEALKNVSFGVKKGEIFGLLGPNGAGKSTTMSILCGMLSPTTGDAFVDGSISVAKQPELVRKSLSVCFQQNILFDGLSVREHLQLVCALKEAIGVKTVREDAWDAKLQQFGLFDKQDALAETLSGGQKRKLSLILALVDASHVVLLDEPTAGMDLKSRLDTWTALRKAVSHRAVILTTHSMQEAQALCENIAIVADGKLKCCGSSLFLRERFGVGYKLTIVHREKMEEEGKADASPAARTSESSTLAQLVRKFVPMATVLSSNKWETRIQLTNGNEAHFVPLLQELEKMQRNREIKRYAVAATDLEDVFVRVTQGDAIYYHADDTGKTLEGGDEEEASDRSFMDSPDVHTGSEYISLQQQTMSNWQLGASRMKALWGKRWILTFRRGSTLWGQYLWPIICFALLLVTLQHMFDVQIETLTSLPVSQSTTSVYAVGSRPELADTVQEMLKHSSYDPRRVVYYEASNAAEMVDRIMNRENGTTFFAAAYVTDIQLPEPHPQATRALSVERLEYSLFYNATISHSLPVGLERISEAFCRAIKSGKATFDFQKACGLIVKSGILPESDDIDSPERSSSSSDEATNRRVSLAIYIMFTLVRIVSGYISPIVEEREIGLKRQQFQHLGSIAASVLYWSSNMVFDYVGYFAASSTIGITLALMGSSFSLSTEVLQAWLVGLALFGLSVLPFSYLLSLGFASHTSAHSFMVYSTIIQIFMSGIASLLSNIPQLCRSIHTASSVLQILPVYSLGTALINVATVHWAPSRESCWRDPPPTLPSDEGLVRLMGSPVSGREEEPSVWGWYVTGSSFCALIVSGIVYSLLLLLLDEMQMYPTLVWHKIKLAFQKMQRCMRVGGSSKMDGEGYERLLGQYEEGSDQDIENASQRNVIVAVSGVSKVYNPRKASKNAATEAERGNGDESRRQASTARQTAQVVALNDVSFSVERNDCVALLGVNGSGKSTMFEILTAGTAPTRGSAKVNNRDVTLQPREASREYGYCPQTNILFSGMNVREHLELFFRLQNRKPISARQERRMIDAWMTRLGLVPVAKTSAGQLSGGNKRRLMLALSLLREDVPLYLFDEPSAGVDVVARRLMWRVMLEKQRSTKSQASCLFTTHSMEEADAVCANAVVLHKGNLIWSGSITDLKQRSSRGVSIHLRLDEAVLLASERVRFYVHKVAEKLQEKHANAPAKSQIGSKDLEMVWKLCRQHYRPVFLVEYADPKAVLNQAVRRDQWFAAYLANLQQLDINDNNGRSTHVVSTDAFVKEWLIHEDFVVLEHFVFTEQITSQSFESVQAVHAQEDARGSGTNTSGIYETTCSNSFGLADLFAVLEANKANFCIAQYSISELSLERVFEQFTTNSK